MAVEIPVVIDIQGAFAEAAKKVPSAISPLQNSMKKLNEDLSVFREMLHEVPVDSKDFQLIAKEIQNISNAMDIANAEFRNYASNTGSIKQMSNNIAFLNDQWEKMAKGDKFTASGKLTKDAKQLYNDYKKITAQLEKQGKSLEQMAQAEKRATEESRRRAEEVNKILQKVNQTRAYENSVLNTSVKSIRVLSEQQRILTDRLRKTKIGTDEFNRLKERLAQVNKELKEATGGVTSMTGAMQKQSGVLRSLASAASMYISVFGVVRLAKQIRDVTGELEYQRVALGHIIQDATKGDALFKRIQEAAIESPFRIKDLVTYTKQLAAYRIEQEELFYTTKRLADISAGLGVDMNRLILAYGQVRAASVLRGQELRQFTEAGIPLVELLAEKFTDLKGEVVSTADVFKLISERAVPFERISEIFEDMTEKGGIFYKMQEEQAKTLKGRWEKLKDAYDIALQSIGDTETFQRQNDIILGALRFLADNLRVVVKLLDSTVIGWAAYNAVVFLTAGATKRVVTEEQKLIIAEQLRTKNLSKLTVKLLGAKTANDALAKSMARAVTGTNALSRAMGKLNVALLTNPVLAIGAAVLSTILIFTRFKKATDETAATVEKLNRSIEDVRAENNRQARIGKLIESYEKLAQVTDKNAAQTATLERVTKKLSAEYPEFRDRLEDASLSLEQRLALVKELNEEEAKRLDQMKAEKEAELKAAESDLTIAEDDLDKKKGIKQSAIDAYNEIYAEMERRGLLGKAVPPLLFTAIFGGTDNSALQQSFENAKKAKDKAIKSYEEAADGIKDMKDAVSGLRKELYGTSEDVDETSKNWKAKLKEMQFASNGALVFENDQLEGWHRLYDVSNDLEKEWKKLSEDLKALEASMPDPDSDYFASWKLDAENVKALKEGLELIRDFFGFTWGKTTSRSARYEADPFIAQLQERMKFMKDFKKGYDDLKKYLGAESALEKEAGIMAKRGMALGIDLAEQKRAARDLSQWYTDAMNETFAKAKKKGARGTIDDFLAQEIKGTDNRSKALRDFQNLIQSLWDAKTDLDTSEKAKEFEEALKRLSDEIKRSEEARDFYKNILDLTGDTDLAAEMSVSVYGGIGKDFKDRLDAQLREALSSIDASQLTDELKRAFESRDFDTILANLDKFPEKWQEMLKKMADDNVKYNADLARDLLKSLQTAKTYSEKRIEISQQTIKRMAEIEAMHISDEAKKTLKQRNLKKESEAVAALEYDAFKDTPMYVELFANLDQASSRMLNSMKENLERLKGEWKNLHPKELKEMQSRLNEIYSQLASRNPFQALIDSIKEYRALQKTQSRGEAEEAAVTANNRLSAEKEVLNILIRQWEAAKESHGENSRQAKDAEQMVKAKAHQVDLAQKESETAQETANQYRQVAQAIVEAANGLKKWTGYVDEAISGIGEIVSTFSSDKTTEAFNIISSGVSKTLSGVAQTAGGVAKIFAGDFTGIVNVISGLGSVIAGTFGTANEMRIRKANKDIEVQADLIEDLEYQYRRLEAAMAKSFGSDYITNYNQQLDNLLAKQEAYLKQAEAERSKGKKADEDKIKEYQNSARDVADQIADMQSQLSEFFTDSDLTSAAKDFANAWIEAYKEFGSTTDAMREKFQEMIQNMVEKSLAAKIMQELLQPIFDQIDILAREGGELSVEDISAIAKMANTALPNINDAMGTLMNTLAAAGYNIRQHPGQFTGISRNIANATEESISGLAAGINTQNFYMSYMPIISANVAAIVGYLTGESVQTSGATPITPTNSELTLKYLSALPTMDENLATLLSLVRSMVIPRSASPSSAQNFLVAKVV